MLDGWAEAQGLRFTFDPAARGYDWLVVYENLPAEQGERRPMRIEQLDCPQANTVLLTTEPSAIKIYGRAYIRQFGHVVTSQEPFALRHPGRIWSQAGLRWFYGDGTDHAMTADEIAGHEPEKTAVLSTVCSTKRQGHTLHRLRYDFTQLAAARLPEMDVFGRGHRPLDDKAEAVDAYKYHLAIENHVAPHHFTEKLADPFLGLALPFYFGAPNAADYFPADSFIAIDIRKPDEAIRIMREAIDGNEYERRLPAIREARRRVIEEHSLFPLVARVIASSSAGAGTRGTIMSQAAAKRAHPLAALGDFLFREALHLRNRLANLVS
ncbi:glycosyltransferase [Rhizobium sp. CG5]|nr:glycosyltransferase [Rhizobium sp. CG5]